MHLDDYLFKSTCPPNFKSYILSSFLNFKSYVQSSFLHQLTIKLLQVIPNNKVDYFLFFIFFYFFIFEREDEIHEMHHQSNDTWM